MLSSVYNKSDARFIVQEAKDCFQKGANAIHAHVRDQEGNHSLDIGLYKELIKELKEAEKKSALDRKNALIASALLRLSKEERSALGFGPKKVMKILKKYEQN